MLPTLAISSDIDLKSSVFKWTGTKVTGSHYGKVQLKSAKLDEKDGLINSGEFVMDMKTISCDDLKGEWMDKLLAHLNNDDFFSVEKFPTATLKIKNGVKGKLSGEMTIKGVTQPVEIDYKKSGKEYTGTLMFDRTKFGIKYGSGNFFKGLGDKMIHDDVSVEFKVVTK